MATDPATARYRLGFDIGGTFTDFVLLDAATGGISLHKCLTTPSDPADGALDGIRAICAAAGIAVADVGELLHGTTLVTNALIEGRGARLGLLTTKGFRDVLEFGIEQRYDIYDLFPRLSERRRQDAGTLSGGERQMLAMGRALMARPCLLMLDEPSLGLAPLIVRDIFRTITALRQTGVAILLIEQNARAALQVADHAYVLETGRITLQGDSATLAADSRIVEMYLGRASPPMGG